ncbi:Hypothetical protein I595_1943 [Croceitalea dokdonensis DOKDO 023]|uniref:Uncharacterized protein n=1 Tax=Croceitalea dokdonensis DOKDO 023 TaxID=1300341 RepID=A0A0P7A6D2_9FLAO|nr:Hypothetical protein I595_1943 [Croceitalea dokdonensis DOKDO 023]
MELKGLAITLEHYAYFGHKAFTLVMVGLAREVINADLP